MSRPPGGSAFFGSVKARRGKGGFRGSHFQPKIFPGGQRVACYAKGDCSGMELRAAEDIATRLSMEACDANGGVHLSSRGPNAALVVFRTLGPLHFCLVSRSQQCPRNLSMGSLRVAPNRAGQVPKDGMQDRPGFAHQMKDSDDEGTP